MEETIAALKSALPRLITSFTSGKFLLCLAVIIGGLVRGGPEGFAAATAAMGFYTGTKAYQNVQFAKLSGNKGEPVKSGQVKPRSTGTLP